jgi:hypothetical protein
MATRERPHIRLRIEPRLLRRLEAERKKSGLTLTGEIIARLERSFEAVDLEKLIEATATATAEKYSKNFTVSASDLDEEKK